MSLQTKHIYEFGPFRLDAAEHLLLRDGEAVPLTPKAFDLLLALVERHGHLLEKDELLKTVWPDTFVEEANLASNISQLRKALGDGENGQRYIETAPKRGYRFVASMKTLMDEGAGQVVEAKAESQEISEERQRAARSDEVATASPASRVEQLIAQIRRPRQIAMLVSAIFLFAAGGFAWFSLRTPRPPIVTGYAQITTDGYPKTYERKWVTAMVSDGSRIYFQELVGGQYVLAQVAGAGGETVTIPTPFPFAVVMDLSPNRAELLVASRVHTELEYPFWVVPVLGGSPRRLGDLLGHSAAWAPDGEQIVYANGSELRLVKHGGTAPSKLATVAGRAFHLRWAPDGRRVRFTLLDTKTQATSLWEVAVDGSDLHPLLPGWNKPNAECCGAWTADGKYFVFQSTRNRATQIWAMREPAGLFQQANYEPAQLTVGPMNYYYPVPSPDGRRLFAVGEQQRGELLRFDAKTRQFASYLPGVSGELLDFSRDGEWVAYVTYPGGILWRSKVDGSQRFQLTSPPIWATLPRWSPDGKMIAFTAVVPGKPWKTYLVSAEGGNPQQLMPEERRELDPGWSPDGKTVVFGDYDAQTINFVDVSTRQVSKLPGSDGLFSPRWSPDGRHLTALLINAQKLLLFDFSSQQWMELAARNASFPSWSRDGKYVYFLSALGDDPALFRVRIVDRKLERVTSLKELRLASGYMGLWAGLAPDDSPLVLRDVGAQDIYALEW